VVVSLTGSVITHRQRGLQREVDLIHHDVLTKQLACTTLERGMAENEVQCLLAKQRQLLQEALQKDELFAELKVSFLLQRV
jgi:hypothetical protein